MRRRRRTAACLALAAVLFLGGCRSVGRMAWDDYSWSSRTFSPNPASVGPYLGGLVIGFVAGLPMCLVSWPLTLLLYPDGEEEYSLSASLAPALLAGTTLGTTLGGAAYPFGLPWVPSGE